MPKTIKPKLHIARCSRQAAEYAVRVWHYSQTMPCGKLVMYGVWENGTFMGAIVFGRGASPPLYKSLQMKQTELVELVRVALRSHNAAVSKILAIALRLLKRECSGLRCVVSFADLTNQKHYGTIYQAGNWIYTGISKKRDFVIQGKIVHNRCYNKKFAKAGVKYEQSEILAKYRYLWPLDKSLRPMLEQMAKPYPKRPSGVSSTSGDQPEGGGANPTLGLS